MTSMTKQAVLVRLKRLVERAGSVSGLARQRKISRGHLSAVLSGRREPGPKILAMVGAVELGPEPPAVVERQGQSKSGGRYYMRVEVANVEINGVAVPNDVAAMAMADMLERGVKE